MGVGMVEGGVCGCGCGYSGGRYGVPLCGLFCTLKLHSKSKDLWYMYVWCLCGVG